MNEFLASIKADLTDRRLLPAVAVVCALLVAAIAYALLGGGSSSPSEPVPVPTVPPTHGIAVSGVTAGTSVAETTDGFKAQTHGTARNPFAPLPGSGPASAGTSASVAPAPASGSEGSSSSSSSTSTESSGGSGSSETSTSSSGSEEKPKPPKKKVVYDVSIKFGVLPPNTAPELAQLKEYTQLKLQTPLPSAKQPLIVFRGVTARGKSATFTLVGEAILTGAGACLPSPENCQAVDLRPGQTEQLNYLEPTGESVIYELRVLSITGRTAKATAFKASKASAARRHKGTEEWGVSRVGQELLRKAGLVALPFLRYSSQPGVLVFASKASKHHAHAARRPAHG
jgi:hypothetical protein